MRDVAETVKQLSKVRELQVERPASKREKGPRQRIGGKECPNATVLPKTKVGTMDSPLKKPQPDARGVSLACAGGREPTCSGKVRRKPFARFSAIALSQRRSPHPMTSSGRRHGERIFCRSRLLLGLRLVTRRCRGLSGIPGSFCTPIVPFDSALRCKLSAPSRWNWRPFCSTGRRQPPPHALRPCRQHGSGRHQKRRGGGWHENGGE